MTPRAHPTTPNIERFEARIAPGPGGCWNWTGAQAGSLRPYGHFTIAGRKGVYAHRWSYEYHRAEIPEGLEIDHLCRNRLCVNPWHLEPVTGEVNRQRYADSNTHCPQGHEYTPGNTYQAPRGSNRGKQCRIGGRARLQGMHPPPCARVRPPPPSPPQGEPNLGVPMSWRVARSLDVLLDEINAAAPLRSKVSDGSIGDAAHATRSSDHNPWVTLGGQGIVRARDFTHDPAGGLDCQELATNLAALIAVGAHPACRSGAYVIWRGHIYSFDRRQEGWRPYSGSNPHDHHLHLSVTTDPMGFESVKPWMVLDPKRDERLAKLEATRKRKAKWQRWVKRANKNIARLRRLTK